MPRRDEQPSDRLDQYWDALVRRAAMPPGADGGLDPALPATVRHLHARDDAPPPDPIFLRSLREDLMHRHAVSSLGTPFGSRHGPSIGGGRSFGERPPRSLHRGAGLRPWIGALETVAAAVLVLAILAGAFAGRRLLPDREPAATTTQAPAVAAGTPDADAAAPGDAGRDVPMLGADPGRTGAHPGPGPAGQPGRRWQAFAGPGVTSPVVVDGVVYTAGGDIAAFSVATGAELWRVRTDGVASVPTVVAGRLYVGVRLNTETSDNSGYVLALDAATGAELWRAATGCCGDASPTVVDGVVYATGDDKLYAFDAVSGRERWSFETDGSDLGSPAVADGVVYVTSDDIFAFDAADGRLRWRFLTAERALTPPVVADGLVYVGAPRPLSDAPSRGDGRLFAVDAKGAERWAKDLEITAPPAVVDGTVYVQSGDPAVPRGELRALDAATGDERWTADTGDAALAAPTVADGVVYVIGGTREGYFPGSDDTDVVALDAASGREHWRLTVGGTVGSAPTVVDGALYVTAYHEGALFALGDTATAAGTPAATPAVGGDVSGRAPCLAEPSPDPLAAGLSGTPRADLGDEFGAEARLPSEDQLPPGDPVSTDTVAEIEAMLRDFAACSDAEPARLIGFFSDDYFRRFAVVGDDVADFAVSEWEVTPFADVTPHEARVLPDGRVGAIVEGGVNPAFVLFVEASERWLIDEVILLLIEPGPAAGGTPAA